MGLLHSTPEGYTTPVVELVGLKVTQVPETNLCIIYNDGIPAHACDQSRHDPNQGLCLPLKMKRALCSTHHRILPSKWWLTRICTFCAAVCSVPRSANHPDHWFARAVCFNQISSGWTILKANALPITCQCIVSIGATVRGGQFCTSGQNTVAVAPCEPPITSHQAHRGMGQE